MEDYKPNSKRFKEEERRKEQEAGERKKVEKVVTGTVKTTKKQSWFSELFLAEDLNNVKNYIFMDVIIPTVKKAISDIARDGMDMLLYGESGVSKRKSGYSAYVSYNRFADTKYERRGDSSRSRGFYRPDDIILETMAEAKEVLSRMDELIENYGSVSVADLYDLVGKTGNYTDHKYGWTSIQNAKPIPVRDGYLLNLPKVTII